MKTERGIKLEWFELTSESNGNIYLHTQDDFKPIYQDELIELIEFLQSQVKV